MHLDYSSEVVAILALDGDGERLMPLAMERCSSEAARARLQAVSAARLFPGARAPEAALSGLYVYFSCFEEAHQIAQDIATAEGSYWHAIVHRQEPDAGNAAYWFRQVGAHPIFPALARAAGREGQWGPVCVHRNVRAGAPSSGLGSGGSRTGHPARGMAASLRLLRAAGVA